MIHLNVEVERLTDGGYLITSKENYNRCAVRMYAYDEATVIEIMARLFMAEVTANIERQLY